MSQRRSQTEASYELALVTRRAFQEAEKYRKGKDLPRRLPIIRKVTPRDHDGPVKLYGPDKYKVTMFFPPECYLELLDRRRAAGFPGGLHGFILRELGLKTPKQRRLEREKNKESQEGHAHPKRAAAGG